MSGTSKPPTKKRTLHKKTREMAYRIVLKVLEEQKNDSVLCFITRPFLRASIYTGLSAGYLRTMYKEGPTNDFATVSSRSDKTNYDDFDRHSMHQTIEDMVLAGPRRRKLIDICKEKFAYPRCKNSLLKMVRKMGYGKQPKVKCVVEQPEFLMERKMYLKKIREYRLKERQIIYIDETWIDHIRFKKYWRIEAEDAVITDVNAKHRLILIHAASKNGFLEDVKWLFEVGIRYGDLQVQMSKENFELWVTNLLLPNLPPNSVVVMDSACYHNELIEVPSKDSTKEEMITWIKTELEGALEIEEDIDKDALFSLIEDKIQKNNEPKYKIDTLIKSHGHDVLRIPTFMNPQFNAMILAWENIARIIDSQLHEADNQDIIIDTKVMKAIAEMAIARVTPQDWNNFDSNVQNMENVYWQRDRRMEECIARLNNEPLNESSDSESE